ncbi:helix-turn-helix domain-containing protein [Streptosporangium carneum]|uniref:Transcriptional regulator n=1 Tax=Streptosporangium carneum TaxID=47481 RepID=A0A9W6MEY9_9ACTN|nr:helix-turn-helix transcriptional regulator [Streptosporangium carneum]GLK11622.1 transcriptional regulator [Streptosporangium carneum]
MRDIVRVRQMMGARLKELRLGAGLTGRELSARHGWQPSKISKLENGRQTPSEEDLRLWCEATGVPDEAADMIASLRSMQTLYSEWRRQLRHGTRARQQSWLEMEAETERFRVFEPCVVPGLLQTSEYARQRLSQSIAFYGIPDDVEDGIATRLRRQEILYSPAKSFHFVVLEAALRLGMAPPDVMLGQLDRLTTLAMLPRVRLGIVPMRALLPHTPLTGFWIMDERAVVAETFSAELTLTLPEEVEQHARMFSWFARVACYGVEARKIIVRAMEDLAG